MKQRKYDAVLFDLDGTVSESHPGIIASAKKALVEYGWEMPEDFDYTQFIGPPICQSLMLYAGMAEPQAEVCMKLYRKYYNAGEIFNTSLYPGMLQLMKDLTAAGSKVCIATSKPQPMADRVIEYLGLGELVFCNAGADTSDKQSDKPGLIRRCMEETGASREQTVMIGDTRFDAAGARVMEVPFIGALYGYGTREEMVKEGAEHFAKTVAELYPMLFVQDKA
ncbi:MAG: HAD hydrolase-like protein [Oscillospiraceae bacterium]|nr:HAD hydrolase-like protein [Oscillospiraceae bacterium]